MTARKANGQFAKEPAVTPGITDWPRFDHARADRLIAAAREASSAYEAGFGAYCAVVDVTYAPPPVVLVSSKPLAEDPGTEAEAYRDPHPSEPLPAGDWALSVTVPADAGTDEKVEAILARIQGRDPFYRLNAETGRLEPAPLDGDGEKHMGEFLSLTGTQDGPGADTLPAAPSEGPAPGPAGIPATPARETGPGAAPGRLGKRCRVCEKGVRDGICRCQEPCESDVCNGHRESGAP